MKSTFLSVCMLLTTAFQPLDAVPSLCQMARAEHKVACSDCCTKQPCCAVAHQEMPAAMVAVQTTSSDNVAALATLVIGLPEPFPDDRAFDSMRDEARFSHSLAPRVLSCIQLI